MGFLVPSFEFCTTVEGLPEKNPKKQNEPYLLIHKVYKKIFSKSSLNDAYLLQKLKMDPFGAISGHYTL